MTKTVLSTVVAMCVALASASAFAQEPKKHKKMVAHQHHMVTHHHHHHHMKPMEPKPAAEEQK